MSRRDQPNLFDDVAALPAPPAALISLAQHIPRAVRFGTSTWTYDGWAGEVYHRPYRSAQPARRLEEYVRYPLFRTVGIDKIGRASCRERVEIAVVGVSVKNKGRQREMKGRTH